MRALLALETAHGRARPFPNAPRVLDLDLLLYAALQLDTPELTLPHPRLHERGFVLLPLAEIAPQLAIPGRGTVAELARQLPDQGVQRLSA
jgi:2-amino-4-hydroxy-6-hydroxymethyldihydropteridine diphosphokinase